MMFVLAFGINKTSVVYDSAPQTTQGRIFSMSNLVTTNPSTKLFTRVTVQCHKHL